MGDSLKLSKDKRHKSSSSLAGTGLEGTRSERKLDIRALIPEDDDHFAIAETRCNELQEKIDLVKNMKRKKKLNKRSTTRVNQNEPLAILENPPLISVRTQPKKRVVQQPSRLRRLEVPPNPTRGYLDSATVEQHRMLGQVWGYGQNYHQNDYPTDVRSHAPGPRHRRVRADRADGDGSFGQPLNNLEEATNIACGQSDCAEDISDTETYDQDTDFVGNVAKPIVKNAHAQGKPIPFRRKSQPRGYNMKEVPKWIDSSIEKGSRQQVESRHKQDAGNAFKAVVEERPVVELFNKCQTNNVVPQQPNTEEKLTKKPREHRGANEQLHSVRQPVQAREISPKKERYHPRRVKYRSRGYEMPTVASQMKQADMRYHSCMARRTNIPFVVSKSTAPSHNIGVNIQQVLNGLKTQQPLNGIPLTIAHHMGLGHVPTNGTKSVTQQPSVDYRVINSIKLGQRLLVLPTYKYMSYSRLLSLYREGDGMVPRFLRAISRPNYFYTSMYNLAINRDGADGAVPIGDGNETKRQLSEYAALYREYEQIERKIKENGTSSELGQRRQEILRNLESREKRIRKLVQESYVEGPPGDYKTNLRATASTTEEGCRHSTFKLNQEPV